MARALGTFLLGTLLSLTFACRQGSETAQPLIPTLPNIASQPANQSVAVGHQATFTVVASGTAPLTYQWFWNGLALTAYGAFFTTPPAVPSDHQSTLVVTVTNQAGTISSTVATLSVPGSPRRPQAGDLRFKDVGAFPFSLTGTEYTSILGGMKMTIPNRVGTPLLIGSAGPVGVAGGPNNCSWSFGLFQLPTGAVGRTTIYQTGILSDFSLDLISLTTPNTLITSLDLFVGQNAYALQAIQTAGTDAYTFGTGTLSSGDLQAEATRQGAASRLMTAVSLSGGQATFISYGWQGDTTTVYEAKISPATVSTVSAEATNLAQQGYILTAVGGNCTDGFLLIGTRVQGDTTPRPFQVTARMIPDRGYTMVGSIFVYNATPSAGSYLYLYEQ